MKGQMSSGVRRSIIYNFLVRLYFRSNRPFVFIAGKDERGGGIQEMISGVDKGSMSTMSKECHTFFTWTQIVS